MVSNSKYRDRFILLGWIPFHQVPQLWKESNVGINIDLFSYEAILGSRNRILDWMQIGLPVLTTDLCELSKIIKENQLGFTFEPENAGVLEAIINWMIEHPDELKERSTKARNFVLKNYNILKTTGPLRKWVENPRHAPDRFHSSQIISNSGINRKATFSHYLASIKNQVQYQGFKSIIRKAFRKLTFVR